MGKQACLDTGLITLLYSKNPPKEISQLFKEIEMEKFEGHIVSPIISEAFYHICNINGKAAAESAIASFLHKYPIKLIHLNQSLIIKAGLLKCQHYKSLSYNDCFAIGYALNKKLTFHTTEKGLKEIVPQLKVKQYIF